MDPPEEAYTSTFLDDDDEDFPNTILSPPASVTVSLQPPPPTVITSSMTLDDPDDRKKQRAWFSPSTGGRDSVPRDSKPSSAKSSHVVVMLSDDAIVPAQSTTTLPPLKRRSKKNDQQSQQQRPSRSRPTHPQRRLSWIHPPSLTAYLQNGLHVIPSPTPPPSTLLPDLVFSLSTSRLIHLLPSLPVTPLPRFLLLTLTLLTTHSLLLHDHDLHLSHDDLLNTLHTLLRTSLLIGLSWSSTRLTTLDPSVMAFLLFIITTRAIHSLSWSLIVIIEASRGKNLSVVMVSRVLLGSLIPTAFWVSGVLVPPLMNGWRETLWGVAVGWEVIVSTGLIHLYEHRVALRCARDADRRGDDLASWSTIVPVVRDWNRDIKDRLVRLTGLLAMSVGFWAIYPLRKGLGDMDGVLIPYSIGPFLISSAAFAIVMSLERIAVSTSPSVLHSHHTSLIVPESDRPPVIESPPKRSLRRGIGTLAAAAAAAAALRFGPSKTSTLSSAYGTHRSRADLVTKPRRGRRVLAFQTQTTPPLSTLWRLLQFPLHLSILVAGCGLRMIVQSLFNEWSGISNYISTYPPGLENLDPTISAASRSPFMDPSLLSSDSNALPVAPQISSIPLPSSNNRAITTTLPQNYASLLMNYTIQQGTSTRSAWAWDPTRGETLLSLGLAAFVVFAAASSMTLSVSNSILACTEEPQEDIQPIQEIPDSQWTLQTPKRLPRRRPHTNPSSLPPLFPSPPPLLPHPSIASLPATKDPSSTPLTTPMTRSWTRLSRRPSKLSTSALPPSRDLSEREEAFWRDVWVTSPEASVKSRRGGTVKSKRGTGKKMKEAMSSESEDESSDSLKDGGFYEDGEGREDDEDVEVVASTSSPLPTPQPVSRCVSPTTRQTPLRGFLLRVVLWGGLLVAAVPLGWWMGSWSGKVGTLGNDVEGWPLWNGTGIIEDEGTVMRGDADGFWTLVICCGVMVVGMVGEEVGRFRRGMALEHDVV